MGASAIGVMILAIKAKAKANTKNDPQIHGERFTQRLRIVIASAKKARTV